MITIVPKVLVDVYGLVKELSRKDTSMEQVLIQTIGQ
jgi:hypothetical protein